MTAPMPRPHPAIVTSLRRSPPRYRRKDTPEQAGQLRDQALVVVDVGTGLRAEDLPRTIAFAQRIRNVRKLLIQGRTQRAVDEARKAFLAAWELDGAPAAPAQTTVGAWAALMLANTPQADGGGPVEPNRRP